MTEEIRYAINRLDRALTRLREGIAGVRDELDKDGVIQRFEFTFELFWKALKVYLEYQGIEARTPRECLKEAFRIDLIKDEGVSLDMLEDRNRTSHIYDQDISEEIFERIRTLYIDTIGEALDRLKERL